MAQRASGAIAASLVQWILMSAALGGCSTQASPTPEGLGAAPGEPRAAAGMGGNFAAAGQGGRAAGGDASARAGAGAVGGGVVISVEPGAAGAEEVGEGGAGSNALDPDDACAA